MADLVLAALLVLAVTAAATTLAVGAQRAESAVEAARTAAITAARTGDPTLAAAAAARLSPGSEIDVELEGNAAVARVRAVVELPHPILGTVMRRLNQMVSIPLPPHRSGT